MKLEQIREAIEQIAPLKLAQDWDNVGFLIGNPHRDIKRILVTIDTTRAVAAEAKRFKADLILAYHPPIWDGLKRVTADGPTAPIYELIQADIGVFAIHTALDTAAGGINDALASIFPLVEAKPIGDYVADPAGPHYKIITFVPQEAVNAVAEALYEAGAGAIGNYSHCGFMTEGVGTFLPLDGANPTIGQRGRLERVNEIRLETVAAADKVAAVIAALRKAHPYETPAFDVFRHYDLEHRLGLGRIGRLEKPTSLDVILKRIQKTTGAKAFGLIGPTRRTVRTAAVCAGSCGNLLDTVIAAGCDLYLTGELKHHQALAAQEAGLTCLCLSHSVSERFALKQLAATLKKRLNTVTIRFSQKDADPFTWKHL
ncbi:MAG: Nif3-like dinuclear metal center hexameric protein [Planctomycetes bacterium]|nr:Nif3-like dinuclear metal center hexameric protein [Planctomycetota bacterium]